MPKDSTQTALIAAATSLTVSTLTMGWQFFKSQQDRRRQLYGEAYKTVESWHEMYYRVSRRASKAKTVEKELVDKFHELQESIDYYRGWITLESSYLGELYAEFANETKAFTEELNQTAWRREPLSPQKPWPADRAHPNKSALSSVFLSAVHDHLSLNPLRKIRFYWKALKKKSGHGF